MTDRKDIKPTLKETAVPKGKKVPVKKTAAKATTAKKAAAPKAKLGSGARFAAVEKSAAKSGAKNPAAVAASVGIKKYGKAVMSKLAQAGKSKKAKGK